MTTVDIPLREIVMKILTPEQLDKIRLTLTKTGLELKDDKRAVLIDQIKRILIDAVYKSDEAVNVKYSVYLTRALNYNYNYLSHVFSQVEHTTITHFIMNQKIERVKNMLVYDELSLTEIAYRLQYSSVAHLSNQFKKVTGLNPGYFKKLAVSSTSS